MKTRNIINGLAMIVVLLTMAACNKGEDNFFYKGGMLPITVRGYNGSNEQLEVKVDTFKFPYTLGAGSTFHQSSAFTFNGSQTTATLTIKETGTGKTVLEKQLAKGDGLTTLNFLYLNGKVSDMPEIPAIETGKIKLVYMFQPVLTNYAGPVDIVLGKYYFTPKVFEEITRIKNVKPNEFTEPLTMSTFATTGQQYNGQATSVLFRAYIYKAGTNEFYTNGTGYTWHETSSYAPVPAASSGSSKLYIFSESAAGNSIRFVKNLEL
ncbi:hypothetical protein [Filimonas effusa]|uniref:DUF4843 domain-containing protein n=1 Tax=Filimonas effusa TaxID=2508721 RepID=A0A4Q1D0P0_9BACT|nr:hypothetical protein [Filimonas effusa]RXK81314.1 hypothetical protein ESB13_20475 [Filimonas effusa]